MSVRVTIELDGDVTAVCCGRDLADAVANAAIAHCKWSRDAVVMASRCAAQTINQHGGRHRGERSGFCTRSNGRPYLRFMSVAREVFGLTGLFLESTNSEDRDEFLDDLTKASRRLTDVCEKLALTREGPSEPDLPVDEPESHPDPNL